MKSIVAGTAGHIDHGKTALVRALTGVDTDRLEEEKRRGISIDLGFAHLDLAQNLRIAFIDVPGHEKFIKNMLAGVGGIDLLLFVIAADESIKPQTREHFEICRLLNIKQGIVVLTKSDAVDAEIVDLVRLEVEEFVTGSFLESAPVVAVSSTTGAGLDELRRVLNDVAATILPKDDSQYLRLPVDRVFSMRGFGTVVTGTMLAGSVSLEQEVEVHPGSRRLRVRGVQVHGKPSKVALAGQRTALNVTGAEESDLFRGVVLAEPGRFHTSKIIDCAFELLSSAKPLKNRAPVHFHTGTSEVVAEYRSLGSPQYARLRLRDPILLLPGDRFIVRMFSPVVTIGGGVVLDIAPPRKDTPERLQLLAEGTVEQRVALLIRESRFGQSTADLIARTGLQAAVIEKAAVTVAAHLAQTWYVDKAWMQATVAKWKAQLAEFHLKFPLLPGLAKEEMRSREAPDAPPALFDALLASDKQLVVTGDVVHLAAHKLALKQDEAEALAKIESAFERAGLAVPGVQEVIQSSGVEAARARSLLQILYRGKKLIRMGDDLVFHHSALAILRGLLATHKGEHFSVGVFKDWTGISRKYAIPLLEYMDREHVTLREGDSRKVL
ncbi:MAG TPA: selenocysteine-specific translation elongation factor [Bryobacteraceae bacterium]|nr:selenocysteine-specific translation elongation factor [Bryobacteraceae bacterium]